MRIDLSSASEDVFAIIKQFLPYAVKLEPEQVAPFFLALARFNFKADCWHDEQEILTRFLALLQNATTNASVLV